MTLQPRSGQSDRPAWWRVVPRRAARDIYPRRFESAEEAQHILGLLPRRSLYQVVAYNAYGKRVG